MTFSRGVTGPIVAAPLEDWTAFMRATGAAAATIRIRVSTLSALVRHSGYGSPTDLTRRDVLTYLARPGLRPWTRVTYWRAIRAWDAFARRFNYIDKSIIKGVPAPRSPQPIARPIGDDEIHLLLASPASRRARAYVRLALYQALRVHEIAKIRGEDFDHVAGWLTVAGKGGVSKPIPIHPEIAKLAATMAEIGYWFPSPIDPGNHVEARAVSTTIANAMAAVGIHATAHRLRDTAATQMQRNVRDLRVTQAFLRHASIVTTQKYTAVSDTALQAAVQAANWDDAA